MTCCRDGQQPEFFLRCLSVPSSGVFFSVNDSMVADTDALLRPWDDLRAHAFTSFALIREVLINLMPSLTLL